MEHFKVKRMRKQGQKKLAEKLLKFPSMENRDLPCTSNTEFELIVFRNWSDFHKPAGVQPKYILKKTPAGILQWVKKRWLNSR